MASSGLPIQWRDEGGQEIRKGHEMMTSLVRSGDLTGMPRLQSTWNSLLNGIPVIFFQVHLIFSTLCQIMIHRNYKHASINHLFMIFQGVIVTYHTSCYTSHMTGKVKHSTIAFWGP